MPDGGDLKVLGIDVAAEPQRVQDRIGYMPQKFGLYEDLSVQENLDLYADLHGVSMEQRRQRYPRLMEMTALGPFTGRLAGRLSGGMKQKLGLACTLVRAPELLLLDEPTVGVDPLSRRELWDIILQLVNEQSLTVLLSTSYLDEAERCGHVVVMHEGNVLAQGHPHDISSLAARPGISCRTTGGPKGQRISSSLVRQAGSRRCRTGRRTGAVRYGKLKDESGKLKETVRMEKEETRRRERQGDQDNFDTISYFSGAALRRWLHGAAQSRQGSGRQGDSARYGRQAIETRRRGDKQPAARRSLSLRVSQSPCLLISQSPSLPMRPWFRSAIWFAASETLLPSIMSASRFSAAKFSDCSVPMARARPRPFACSADYCRQVSGTLARGRSGSAPRARLGAPAYRLCRAEIFTLRPALGRAKIWNFLPALITCAARKNDRRIDWALQQFELCRLGKFAKRQSARRFQAAFGDGGGAAA